MEMSQRHIFDQIPLGGDKSYTRIVHRNKFNQDVYDGLLPNQSYDYRQAY